MQLGLRANLAQFSLLVAVNALVGGMLGQERTVAAAAGHPTCSTSPRYTAALTFILAFGAVKAATNFFAGTLSDRFGRKPVLVAGWLDRAARPAAADLGADWGWVIAANVLLGVNQGLTWSTTVIMKIDLVGPHGAAWRWASTRPPATAPSRSPRWPPATSPRATGCAPPRSSSASPSPRLGLGLSTLFVRETRGHARLEAAHPCPGAARDLHGGLTTGQVFVLTSFKEPALSAASQAGLVNNLNDGLAWGLFPRLFARGGLSVGRIGVLAALYPAVWGLGQLVTGALSDRSGRKWLIAAGMWAQAAAIGLIAAGTDSPAWAVGALLLGAGTAMVYPTLLAVDRRRRPPRLAGPRGRHLPALARRRLRRRRPARRHHRRPARAWPPRSGSSPRSPPPPARRRGAHVRNPPPARHQGGHRPLPAPAWLPTRLSAMTSLRR